MTDERYDIVPGLRREWMLIVRRRRIIALVVVSAFVGATLYNYTLRPVYEAAAVVAVGEASASNPLARMSTEVTRLGAIVDRQRTLIRSQEFSSKVVEVLDDEARKELAYGSIGTWWERVSAEWARRFGGTDALSTFDTVAAYRSRLRVMGGSENRSSWIEIRFSAYDPKVAADVANAIMNRYLDQVTESNDRAVEQSRKFMNAQVEEREQRLGEQLSGLREMGGTGAGDLEVRKAMLERELRAFQEALVNAQTARVGREARKREATQLRGGVAAVRSDPLIRAASTKVTELEDREATLLATLGPKHPDVLAIHQQLEAARQRLNVELGTLEEGADSEYQLAVNEETRLKTNVSRIQREIADLEKETLSYSLERRKFEVNKSSIDSLVQRQANASPVILDVQPVQVARPNPVPVSPQRTRNFGFALMGGLVAGLMIAWMSEKFDDSVQSPEDVREALGLPFLGIVPLIRKLPSSLTVAIGDAKTGLADSLRVVRTNLIYGSAESKPKVIACTSASPGEGKSTIAAGLAMLFAQNKSRVLLIDGDLRRPSVHHLVSMAQNPGLSGILAADGPPVLATRPGPVRGLDVLTAGTPQNLSAERLGSDAMKALMDQARARYDWIIVDCPPALGLSDAAVVATLADGIVVVCSGDKTPRQAVRHVADQLKAVRANVLGVVLNRIDLHRHSYYYGRYYSAYYGAETENAKRGHEVRESPSA